jgi:hypothetical protein
MSRPTASLVSELALVTTGALSQTSVKSAEPATLLTGKAAMGEDGNGTIWRVNYPDERRSGKLTLIEGRFRGRSWGRSALA